MHTLNQYFIIYYIILGCILFLFLLFLHLFICVYIVWATSPHCLLPHPHQVHSLKKKKIRFIASLDTWWLLSVC
jgi:hypothetical protein